MAGIACYYTNDKANRSDDVHFIRKIFLKKTNEYGLFRFLYDLLSQVGSKSKLCQNSSKNFVVECETT